jgi:hypothetical protein
VTLDVATGSGTYAATFYHSDSLTGTWVQFGAVVDATGTASIDDSSQTLGTYSELANEMFGLEIRQGIAGTVRASVDWTAVTSGVTTYTDGQGNVWTPTGNSTVTNRHYRFVGEVSSWPQRWGRKGAPQAHSPIECSGVLRRLGQGASPCRASCAGAAPRCPTWSATGRWRTPRGRRPSSRWWAHSRAG